MLRDLPGPLRYLRLTESAEARRVCSYLQARPGSTEIPRAGLFRQRGESFRDPYLALMARLNQRNTSLEWWAMPFTDKHGLARTCFRDMSCFLLIVELVREHDGALVVATDSADLAAQVRDWGKREQIEVVDLIKHRRGWKDVMKRHTPAAVVAAALRTTGLWLLSRSHRPPPDRKAGHLVVTTVTHPWSFTNGDYRDAYFGPLVKEAPASSSAVLIMALMTGRSLDQLRSIRRLRHVPPIVPLESFLTFKDLLACTWRALTAYANPPRPEGNTHVDGLDLNCLVNRTVRDTVRSGAYFTNLRVYYAARNMARRVRVDRCLYPYENRSLEKMLLLAVRGDSPETRMVGYQHASMSPSHLNFTTVDGEAEATPMPDVVLTTGHVAKDRLERQGSHPPDMFKAACALRQGSGTQDGPKPRSRQLTNLLVALANSVEEYIGTLSLLEQTLGSETAYQLRVRPHPTIPLETALGAAAPGWVGFYSESTGTLAEDLEWADVVLYASSTVGLEAVARGIPAVYLDLGGFLSTDPMFGWDELKWSATDPEELMTALRRIEAVPKDRFRELQQAGQAYAASYLTPVTPAGLRTFWED